MRYVAPMSEYDPFRAPVADLAANRSTPVAGAGEPGAVPSEIVELLGQTKPWVTFLAVLGFVSTGLMVMVGLLLAVTMAMQPKQGLPAAVGLVYVGIGVFYVFPSLLLLRFGTAIRRLMMSAPAGGIEALTDVVRRQKSFWRFMGICALVMMGIYGLFLVGAFVYGIIKALHH
jgi:hypothetical protein